MPYRILVATGTSPAFRSYVRQSQPGLDQLDYQQHLDALLFESFGWSDAYAIEFRKLGCEAETLIVSAPELQRQWAAEQGLTDIVRTWKLLDQAKRLAERTGVGLSAINQRQKALLNQVFLAQVERFQPDILFIQLQTPLTADVIRTAKQSCRLVIGQLASRFPAYLDMFGVYDIIFSAFPHYVRLFNESGLRGHYLPLAFEPAFMERCHQRYGEMEGESYQAVFVGSVSEMHTERLQWLSALAQTGLVDIRLSFDRGESVSSIPPILRERSSEPIYGLAMYDVYRKARIALNAHPEISGPYAAILRMYEVTGSGCMLLTDERQNLADLFIPGEEVVTYRDTEDCIAKLDYYLSHEDERAEIARRGQQRTLAEHNFGRRAAQILEAVSPLLG